MTTSYLTTDASHLRRVEHELEHLHAGCELETLIQWCSDLTWSQVLLAIDELSRNGRIRLTLGEGRRYWVQFREGKPAGRGNSETGFVNDGADRRPSLSLSAQRYGGNPEAA